MPRQHRARLSAGQKYARQTYLKMLKIMSPMGFTASPEMTPMEFAETVKAEGFARWEDVLATVRLFYAVRFGEEPLTASDRHAATSALRNLKKA